MSARDDTRARRAIEARLSAGISLSALAAELAVSKGRLWKIQHGLAKADAGTLAALGVRVYLPRGIRVRMSQAEANAVWCALSGTSAEAVRVRIQRAMRRRTCLTD